MLFICPIIYFVALNWPKYRVPWAAMLFRHNGTPQLDLANRSNGTDEGHFFGAATEAMRRILVERARHKARLEHGGELVGVDLRNLDLVEKVRFLFRVAFWLRPG